jgi:2-dehydro-3-deoxy-D-arabinonate dehydratase
MYLTKHVTLEGPRWAADAKLLPPAFDLDLLLSMRREVMLRCLEAARGDEDAGGELLPPIDPGQEVWAAGVTYIRSRQAREAESLTSDIYTRVYEAERPELFMKAVGWRVSGSGGAVRIRRDSRWNVPEPELTLVVNGFGEIVGYCAGNDLSSRDIEGENPLYLPQAKVYTGSCALGPGIALADPAGLRDLPIQLEVLREGTRAFRGATSTSAMKRSPEELVAYLMRELDFPRGAFLMTGTGIVPGEDFSLQVGDTVRISVGTLALENFVA